jgi:molybdate transport system ATP-binding protein
MTLAVSACHRLGAFDLDVTFESSGRLIALFGPSGSGKTSIVNIIAGLVRPHEARVEVEGRVLTDTRAGIVLPPHRRRIGYVFQDARLFPHLSVEQNLRYGRFFTARAERYADFGQVVEMLGIGHLLGRRPSGLSGGEKQRVAIGRALLASPRLMLMDEPLAALDDARKAEILPYIERLRDETKIPIVYVSHAITEVARLATDIVVLAHGRVAAAGPVSEVLSRLDLVPDAERGEGGSLIDLTVVDHDRAWGLTRLAARAGEWRLPLVDAPPGSRVRVRVRARDVMLSLQPPAGISALNVLPGTIVSIEEGDGAEALVTLDCAGDAIVARVTRQSVAALGLSPGRAVHGVIKTVTFDRGAGAYALR